MEAGSCCSLAAGKPAPSWAADSWREEGLEVVRQDRRDTAVWGEHSWEASGGRRGLPSSSWTAGSGSLLRTCRSWWWT